ncbi:NmrA family transcriptional regulator [Sorangium cellulosum]|uniref:NmrA family transcriptional regulator n=1 Tax=Sorangium cellulosum TaxID=56 RepID=A0A2L0EVZ1_SORCE|nr:NmrA family NAD(P)-binding protein [Sorangium cellulosum]AUX43468.1 NmrA family transcriptional regulator [Sorangium cellulosum]
MFAVAGVTGNTGSVVARELLAAGQAVRVIVRDAAKGEAWKARGADVAVAQLDDAVALARALDGVKGAYLLSPPSVTSSDPLTESRSQVDAMARAVAASAVPHVVFLSSIAAHHPDRTGPILTVHYAEQKLSAAARDVTFVRPSYFLENWRSAFAAVKGDGVLPSFLQPGRAFPMVATEDIGRVAAERLLAGPAGRQVVELTGPEDYTPEAIARALGNALLGREAHVVPLPVEQAEPILTSLGVSPAMAALYREMYTSFHTGHVDFERRGGAVVRGKVGAEAAFAAMAA